jgi:hypothetical protein
MHWASPRKRQKVQSDASIHIKVGDLRPNQQESVLYFNNGNQVDVEGNILRLSQDLSIQHHTVCEKDNIDHAQDHDLTYENQDCETKAVHEQEVAELESAILIHESSCESAEITPLLHQISTAHLLLLSKDAIEVLVGAAAHRIVFVVCKLVCTFKFVFGLYSCVV